MSASVGLLAALLALGMSSAPGRRELPPLFAPAALEEVVKAGIEAARRQAGALDDDVLLEVRSDSTRTSCDERLVRQAVINLVTNALDAPGRRGAVRVRIESVGADERQEESLVIHVIDDGGGVPADLQERIFTPFYTTRPRGTGLGLAIVRSSAEAHGGEVAFTETLGGGATFTIRLPRRQAASA